MIHKRLIARLDVKGEYLIKGVHLEGLRKLGDPQEFAKKYYHGGADEIIYMDVVASLYGRNNLSKIVEHTAENVFIPITVGGGIRSVEDVRHLLRCGADKIAINTAAIEKPQLISEIAEVFGNQCVVLSVEAGRQPNGQWGVYTDNGREKSKYELLEWVTYAEKLGVGEILLTSIDQEGTGKGFDLELIELVSNEINIPLIVSGGMGKIDDISAATSLGADAIAMADIIHYNKMSLAEIRHHCLEKQINVRHIS